MSLTDLLTRKDAATPAAVVPAPERELVARRARLTEQFTVAQAELGGIFYEMAIRDHVRLDILTKKAAALQRIDAELAEVDRLLGGGQVGTALRACPSCGAATAERSHFCSNCGHAFADAV